MDRIELPPKAVSEVILVTFDFTNMLPAGAVLINKGVRVVVLSGTDPSPSSILLGAATLSGNIVSQIVQAGVAGVTYELICAATTTSLRLMKNAYLSVIPGFSNVPLTPPEPPPPITCVTAFDRWVFCGYYTQGSWDSGSSTWTPSGLLDSNATFANGDSLTPSDPPLGKWITQDSDLGAFSSQFVAEGFWIPEGSFAFNFFAQGEACDLPTEVSVPALETVVITLSNSNSQSATITQEHPLNEVWSGDPPTSLRVFTFSVTLDGSPWGTEFTVYIGADPLA